MRAIVLATVIVAATAPVRGIPAGLPASILVQDARDPDVLYGDREHLQRALTYDAVSAASHYFMAETLIAMDRWEDARRELEGVLAAPLDPAWVPEVREFQRKARKLLADRREGR